MNLRAVVPLEVQGTSTPSRSLGLTTSQIQYGTGKKPYQYKLRIIIIVIYVHARHARQHGSGNHHDRIVRCGYQCIGRIRQARDCGGVCVRREP